MKIWFTEIGEPLPLEKDVRLHRYGLFTQALARKGHEITWWTSTFSHSTKIQLFEKDTDVLSDGVRLKLLKGPGYPKNISLARFKHQAHFAKRFYDLAQQAEKPDLIVTPIPTLEVAEMAVRLAKKSGIPVVADVRDEWPEEFVDLAPKPLRPLARLALHSYFEKMKFIAREASGIIGVSRRQLDYGLKYAGRELRPSDVVLPLGYSIKTVSGDKLQDAETWWLSQGVDPSRFVICCFATLGSGGHFDWETVFKGADLLGEKIQLVICGDGDGLARLKSQTKNRPNVILPGWMDFPKIASLMEMSAAGIAPYSSGTRMSLPNKPWEYMAGKLPVLSSIEGEFEEILERFNCGINYKAGSVDAFVQAVKRLIENPSLRQTMGENARRSLEEHYTTESITEKLEDYLLQF
jgi:glycosyltransferase involved in cell wall biosynthesis